MELQIIGSYDRRSNKGNIAAPDAHKMATRTPKPRKPKARSIEEIQARAKAMGVKLVFEGKEIVLYPPKFDAQGNQVGHNHGTYWLTTKARAWSQLDEMAIYILECKSDRQIQDEAQKALELLFA